MTFVSFCALVIAASAPTLIQTPPAALAATAPSAKFTLDTPIETIAADPAGKAVLDADFPGLTAHPMYDSFKAMSLSAVAPMSGGQITEAQLAKAKVDLEAIK